MSRIGAGDIDIKGQERCLAISPAGDCPKFAVYKSGFCWEHMCTHVPDQARKYVDELRRNVIEIRHVIENACLQGVDFASQDLSGWVFRDCDLRWSVFENCKATSIQLHNCWLDESSWAGANLSNSRIFYCCIKSTDFSRARMNKAKLFGSNLAHTVLTRTNWSNGNAEECDLTGSNMIRSTLTNARFTGCEFNLVCLDHAEGESVIFDRAILTKASLSGAKLTNATFRNAVLKDAQMKGATCSGADFRGADLSGACFDASDLSGAKFSNQSLSLAHFVSAIVTDVDRESAGLYNAKLIKDGPLTFATIETITKINPCLWDCLFSYPKYLSIYRFTERGLCQNSKYILAFLTGSFLAVLLHVLQLASPVSGFWVGFFGLLLLLKFCVTGKISDRQIAIRRLREKIFKRHYRGAKVEPWMKTQKLAMDKRIRHRLPIPH